MANLDSKCHDLQDLDLEQNGPPSRELTWYRRLVIDVRWISKSSLSNPPVNRPLSPTEETFISTVTGEQIFSRALNLSCNWYIAFLEHKINEAWNTLFRPVLVGIHSNATYPCGHDITISFQFLTAVVLELKRKEIALVDIVDTMYNKGLFCQLETDYERSRAHQLVFAAFGWISMLYSASLCPKPDRLELEYTISRNDSLRGESLERRNSAQRPRTFSRLEENIENNDEPLFRLLSRFGDVIPQYWQDSGTTQEWSSIRSGHYDDSIDISLVCFYAVNVVAGIRIQWVDCLSLHLEFDSRTKTLKLFRFPSLCLIMYRNDDRSLLSQIFQDFVESTKSCWTETDYASEYFREFLLTYRLLFGENKRSHRAFSNRLNRWRKEWKSRPRSNLPEDPILLILGSQSWESDEAQRIYDEIDAEDPINLYSSTSHFVVFGKRLLKLQNYVRRSSSRSLRALLYNRRNMIWQLTCWVGVATLFFALLQSVLQIEQVVLAQQQLNQGNYGSHL